jgi:hypothetical protein
MPEERLRFVPHIHAAGESVELPYEVVRALAWWVVAELIRRHSKDLRVLETHPGGGQYDCLSLYWRSKGDLRLFAHLNLLGHIAHAGWFDQEIGDEESRFNWLDVLASDDRRRTVVEQIERVERMPSPKSTPPTNARSIGPRILARFATSALFSSHRWEIQSGYYDSSGMWSGVNDFVSEVPGVNLERLPNDPFGEPAARYWFILDHKQRPFTAIDVERGRAWRRDGAGDHIDLMALYKLHHCRVDAVMKEVAPDVE